MIRLFDPENRFWSFFGKLTDASLMSLLWVLTSLPLITIGASTTAFYKYTLLQVQDLEGSLVKSYFTAFRAYFKKATLLWLLQLAGTAFFAADLLAAWNFFLFHPGLSGIAVLGLCGFFALAFLCCTFYLYPVLGTYDLPLKQILSASFFLAVGNLHVTLTLALLMGLACVAAFYISGLFFFWIALFVFFSSYLIYGVFLKLPGLGGGEETERQKEPESVPNDDEKWLV